jgi:ATP-dependent Clp protease protease subunit
MGRLKSKKTEEQILIMNDSPPPEPKRVVSLIGEINEDNARQFICNFKDIDDLQEKGAITVILCSPGGEENYGWAIYDTIKTSRSKVIIEGYGQVQSMAAVIFQAGDKRLLSPQSTYMIHNGIVELASEQDRLANRIEHLQKGTKKYQEALSEGSGIEIKTIKKMCENETFFSAKEAVELGLADALIVSKNKGKRCAQK